ncbi:hypothetical protein IZU27_09220 [Treponema socranskii]|uniref:hypothetical protein n=1 Tax=Treponema socranskii TaxID=53419 RepID=UPI003D8E41D1
MEYIFDKEGNPLGVVQGAYIRDMEGNPVGQLIMQGQLFYAIIRKSGSDINRM